MNSLTSKLSLNLCWICLLLLNTIGCTTPQKKGPSIKTDEFNTPSLWAPGVINNEQGTIEFKARFLRDQLDMQNNYTFLYKLVSNRRQDGTHSTMGLVMCPTGDPRSRLLWILRNTKAKQGNISCAEPGFIIGRSYIITVTWGQGKMGMWIDGKLIGETAFKAPVGQVSSHMKLGTPGFIDIEAMKISDIARNADYCKSASASGTDKNTTVLLKEDGKLLHGSTKWQRESLIDRVFPVRYRADCSAFVGEKIKIPFRMINFSGKARSLNVSYKIQDFHGKVAGGGSVPFDIAADATYSQKFISLPGVKQSGFHTYTLTVPEANGEKTEYQFGLAVLHEHLKNPKDGAIQKTFGNHHFQDQLPDAYTKFGVNWQRYWSYTRQFLWYKLEEKPGEFNWDDADRSVADFEQRGVQMLGVLGYPPAWASTYSNEEAARMKKLGSLKGFRLMPARHRPRNLTEWENYIRAVVKRYKGRIDHWEIYNEVDYHPYNGKHATFSGTAEDYLDLLKSAYKILKEENPEGKLLISGFNMNGAADMDMPLKLFKLGAADYFDIFNMHGYCSEERAIKTLKALQEVKPGAKYWQSEITFLRAGSDNIKRQSKNMVAHYLWSLNQGVEKYFWHADGFEGYYKIATPHYSCLATFWSILRGCEKLDGDIEGLDAYPWLTGWSLTRTDGDRLYVFTTDSNKTKIAIAPVGDTKRVLALDVLGKVIYEGAFTEELELSVENLAYLICDGKIKVVSASCDTTNLLNNASYETIKGDTGIAWSNARPAYWTIRTQHDPKGKVSVEKDGHTGNYSLKLSVSPTGKNVYTFNKVPKLSAGAYNYSVYAKNTGDKKVELALVLYNTKTRKYKLKKSFWIEPGTEFQKIKVDYKQESSSKGPIAAIIKNTTKDSAILIDDAKLSIKK